MNATRTAYMMFLKLTMAMMKWSEDWNNIDFINCSFGLSLVRLDIRQDSERHVDVIAINDVFKTDDDDGKAELWPE